MTCKPQCSVTVEETNLRQRGNKQQRQGSKPPTAHAQHNNSERTDEPEARPKAGTNEAADERPPANRRTTGRQRSKAREGEGGKRPERKRKEGDRGRRGKEEAKARAEGGAGQEGKRQAGKEDNRQPQEHERERRENKLVPTTTQRSNSLRAQGRDGRVVVRRRRRTAATAT